MAEEALSDNAGSDYAGLPATREEARTLKARHYFPGPCVNGHNAPRYTSIGRCVICQTAATKKIIDKNPALAKEKARNRYASRKDVARAVVKAWYKRTADARSAYTKKRYQAQKERIKAVRRSYIERNRAKEAAWQRQSRERRKTQIAAATKEYKKANRHIYAAAQKARQTLQLSAMPPWADKASIAAVYAEANRLSQETGVRHSVDHIYPLKGKTSCGLHVPWNLQVLTLRENIRKGNKPPDEWRRLSESEIS